MEGGTVCVDCAAAGVELGGKGMRGGREGEESAIVR
jgi:hypothetical protein